MADLWIEAEKPLITVVVAVYQTYCFVSECVESLRRQTYGNLELILVDDGSTDGAGMLCDEFAAMDERIRVIHQKNRGLMAARAAGFTQGRGEYFAFVDSDDVVSPLYIERLYGLAAKYDADIAACLFVRGRVKAEAEEEPSRGYKDICMTSRQMLKGWHGRYKKYETVMWNKLYHKEVLIRNGVMERFLECRRHEDVLVSHLIVENADKIALCSQPLYFYRVRKDSITSEKVSRERVRQNLDAQRSRMEFFLKKKYRRSYCRLLKGYVLHRVLFGYRLLKLLPGSMAGRNIV